MQTDQITLADIDLKIAERFLDLLGAKRCTFQTFDDKAQRKSRKLARILHGSLNDHIDDLVQYNSQGAGVFVAVNQTDEIGPKRENIKRVRAIPLDLDGGPLDPVLDCHLKPHIIVESSRGRHHGYWLVHHFPLDQFQGAARAVAKRFDGDPGVAMLTHVARLPGFYHCKGEPFRTRIVQVNHQPPYSAEQIIEEFPPEAKPHKPPESLSDRLVLPTDDPLPCARMFVEHKFTTEGAVGLQYYRGGFYRWVRTHYVETDEQEVRSKLYEFLKDALTIRKGAYEPFKPTPAKVNSIVDALKAGIIQTRENNVPFWVEPLQNTSAEELIACRNGLLDIETRELKRHSPYFFNVNCLPFAYDPNAQEPKAWHKFLMQLWPEDREARRALRRMFGLMLTPDTRHQKIFMIVGPKRSGKGTIGRVLTALLGRDNVAAPTLASLSTNFGLSPLIGKLLAIISDARLGPQTNAHAVAERLLSISGEDLLTVDRKYRDPWTGRLGARFLILTNELPRIADASGALASRFIVLTLTESFYGKEDLGLTDRLLTDLPGIMNWALSGLDQLREDGRFIMPKSSADAIRTLDELSSPIGAFLRDWCAIGPNERENVKVLYDAWCRWCGQHGHKAGADHVFGRNLHAVLPRVRTHGKGQTRFYQGVGLSEDGREEYDIATRYLDRS